MTDQASAEGSPVTRALDQAGIPYRFFRHPGQVRSLEQAAAERGQLPEQIIRSIVFRLEENEYVMVLAAGPEQISWPALRKHLGLSRLTMADPQEVEQATGYPPGAVSPFGLPQPMRILADPGIYQPEEVSVGAGVRNATVILRQEDLQRALGEIETVSLVKQKEP
jgi:Cys-tRNA(Pro) deacylase